MDSSTYLKLKKLDKKINDNATQLADIATQTNGVFINAKYPPTPLSKAKGDGITDDTLIIQNIINYIDSLGGGTLFFPVGNYIVCTSVYLVSKSNITIIGANGVKFLIPSTTTASALFNDDAAISNFEINNIYFKYNVPNNNECPSIRFTKSASNNIRINNCIFDGFASLTNRGAISFSNGTYNIKVRNNIFKNFINKSSCIASWTVLDLYVESNKFDTIPYRCIDLPCPTNARSNNIYVINNYCVNFGSHSSNVGAFVNSSNSDNMEIRGNQLKNIATIETDPAITSPSGIKVAGGNHIKIIENTLNIANEIGVYECIDYYVINNRLINSSHIEVNDNLNTLSIISNINGLIKNNIISYSKLSGVFASGKNIIISDNIISYGDKNGIKIAEGSNFMQVTNNILFNNNQGLSSDIRKGNGILISNDADTAYSQNLLIQGNYCYDDQATHTQNYGIFIDGKANFVKLIHNLCSGNVIDQIYLASVQASATWYTIEEYMNSWNPKIEYRSTAPTTGIYNKNDIVYNTNVVAGGTIGWICITSGDFSQTPPVFKTFGTISA